MPAKHDSPTAGVELRHLLVVSDYARSLAFYRDVLGATVVREFPGTLCFLSFGGSQILLTVPGGPTQDKPTVTFAPPADADRVSSELAIRVPDCSVAYEVSTPTYFWLSRISWATLRQTGRVHEVVRAESRLVRTLGVCWV